MALTAISAANATFEVQTTGDTTWMDIPGVSSYTENETAATVTEITAFSGSAALVGPTAPGTVTVEIAAVSPALPVMKLLRTARNNSTSLTFQFTAKERVVYSGADGFSIATSGAVTFNTAIPNAAARLTVGMVLKEDTDRYQIISVGDDGAVMVEPVTTAITESSAYSIVVPSVRRGPFDAVLSGGTSIAATVGGALTSTLDIVPFIGLPDITVL